MYFMHLPFSDTQYSICFSCWGVVKHSFILLFSTSEKVKKEREKERREQYKQVRAHVKKDDGRMQAYGWSLPAKFIPQASKESQGGKSGVPVPVPVYCRPLLDKETGLKVKQLFCVWSSFKVVIAWQLLY